MKELEWERMNEEGIIRMRHSSNKLTKRLQKDMRIN